MSDAAPFLQSPPSFLPYELFPSCWRKNLNIVEANQLVQVSEVKSEDSRNSFCEKSFVRAGVFPVSSRRNNTLYMIHDPLNTLFSSFFMLDSRIIALFAAGMCEKCDYED